MEQANSAHCALQTAMCESPEKKINILGLELDVCINYLRRGI